MTKLPKKLKAEIIPLQMDINRFSINYSIAEQIIRFYDPFTDKTWGYVVIDNTKRGPGLGGIRMIDNVTLSEIKRLARIMTFKNSLAYLPYGGGKAGLMINPMLLNNKDNVRKIIFEQFTEALFPIQGYIPAPDMGTNEHDIQLIYEKFSEKLGTKHHKRGGASRPSNKGGIPIDSWGLTAHGLFAAVRTIEETEENFKIKNCRVVIQGFGNVGAGIALKLKDLGAIVIGASDINAAFWHPTGLDINLLNKVRLSSGGLSNYSGPYTRKFPKLEWLLEAPCDLLIPAARPDAITSKNADRLQCRYILQGANAPSNKMTEYYLQKRRGIISLSDLAVNVGGVIGCSVELKMTVDKDYHIKVSSIGSQKYIEDRIYSTVRQNILEILRRLGENGRRDMIFREEAYKLAEERLNIESGATWL